MLGKYMRKFPKIEGYNKFHPEFYSSFLNFSQIFILNIHADKEGEYSKLY